ARDETAEVFHLKIRRHSIRASGCPEKGVIGVGVPGNGLCRADYLAGRVVDGSCAALQVQGSESAEVDREVVDAQQGAILHRFKFRSEAWPPLARVAAPPRCAPGAVRLRCGDSGVKCTGHS